MSDQNPEQPQENAPPQGDEAPPQVEPIAPPEPPNAPPEPVGRTAEAEAGEPPTDQDQGVGVAPTEPGDAGEGNPGTAFQTTEEIEGASKHGDDVERAI